MSTQKNFDVKRYLGKWYEIAKYKFKWEIGCAFSMAEYSWNDGILNVKNTCLDENRKPLYSRSAIAVPNANDPSKLKIDFNDGLPSDPVGNYWVHWTDYDNYSIVGGPEKKFLWILSRTPEISAEEALMLLNKVSTFGYDSEKLVANPKVLKRK